jgi:hypothetical protein
MIENTEPVREGWKLKDEVDLPEAEDKGTRSEQKLQTTLQTGITVPLVSPPNHLKSLVGAPGLEPGTR